MEKDFLYKLAEKIFRSCIQKDKSGRWFSKRVRGDMEKLYPSRGEQKAAEHYIKKIRLSLLIFLAGVLLAGCTVLLTIVQPIIKENRIPREDYEGNTQEIPVEVHIDGEKGQELVLRVRERLYNQEQLKDLYNKAIKELEKTILGENSSLSRVETDLNLVTELPGYPFQIDWECQDYNIIGTDGQIRDSEVPKEGVTTGIKAIFTYEDFQAEYLFYINIYPEPLSAEEREKEKLLKALEKANIDTENEEAFLLPDELEGKKLEWNAQKDTQWLTILCLTFFTSVSVYFLKDDDLKKEVKKREAQMQREYPEIVSKLSVYLAAGMSIRMAWEKIVADYEKKRLKNKFHYAFHYAYEEMKIACQEMKSGVSEMTAYDEFGKRCGMPLYRKLSTLLIQNMRKGSTSLGTLLKEESRAALEERRNTARKAGEEAGTKLLLPMMLLLCMVMLMILFPAFVTF